MRIFALHGLDERSGGRNKLFTGISKNHSGMEAVMRTVVCAVAVAVIAAFCCIGCGGAGTRETGDCCG